MMQNSSDAFFCGIITGIMIMAVVGFLFSGGGRR